MENITGLIRKTMACDIVKKCSVNVSTSSLHIKPIKIKPKAHMVIYDLFIDVFARLLYKGNVQSV